MMVKTQYKTYPKYEPSGVEWIGEIPEGWEVTNLKRVLIQKITDGPHETPELIPDGIPFISAEAIKNNKIDFDLRRGNISIQLHNQYCKKAKPKLNDFFFIKSGATTGNIAYVETTEEFSIWSPLALIRCYENILFYKYLFYLMLSNEFRIQVELAWSYGTQQNIGMGVIGRLLIILPPLCEQRAIADFLDRETAQINGIVAKQTHMIELLKEKRSALITASVIKGLDPKAKMKPSGVEWIGEIPEGWETVFVKRKSQIFSGGTPDKSNHSYWENGSVPWLSSGEVNKKRIFEVDGLITELGFNNSSAKMIRKKSVIIALNGQGKTKGTSAILEVNSTCNQSLAAIEPNIDLFYVYLYYYLDSRYSQIRGLAGEARDGLSLRDIKHIILPLPPLPEQRAIADFLDRETLKVGTMVGKIEKQIELLNEYKQSLITHAVTGKIDLRGELNA